MLRQARRVTGMGARFTLETLRETEEVDTLYVRYPIFPQPVRMVGKVPEDAPIPFSSISFYGSGPPIIDAYGPLKDYVFYNRVGWTTTKCFGTVVKNESQEFTQATIVLEDTENKRRNITPLDITRIMLMTISAHCKDISIVLDESHPDCEVWFRVIERKVKRENEKENQNSA